MSVRRKWENEWKNKLIKRIVIHKKILEINPDFILNQTDKLLFKILQSHIENSFQNLMSSGEFKNLDRRRSKEIEEDVMKFKQRLFDRQTEINCLDFPVDLYLFYDVSPMGDGPLSPEIASALRKAGIDPSDKLTEEGIFDDELCELETIQDFIDYLKREITFR